MYPNPEKYVLWYSAEVSLENAFPYITDSPTIADAARTYLQIKEENWKKEHPRPIEARFIQSWFMQKITDLYPSYQFLVDGYEISTEEAMRLNIYTWNIKLQIIFSDELSKALEKEN